MFLFTGLALVLVAAQNVYGQDVQVTLDKSCYNEGDSMTLTATYAGSDTFSAVVWYFSGRVAQDVIVLKTGCNLFQTDSGFPLARMTYKCPPDTADSNTYQLILSSLVESDFGSYDWGATFQVASTSNPDVVKKQPVLCQTTTVDDSLSAGKTAGIVIGSVGGAGLLVGGAIFAYFKCKGDKEDTSRDVESTRSSPEKAENKLLNKEKQSSATGKADGGNKGKHVSDTQIHLDKSQKVHPENEEKLFRPQPLPPPGAKLNHSLTEDNHGTGAGDSFSLTKLPPIQKTPRTDKPN